MNLENWITLKSSPLMQGLFEGFLLLSVASGKTVVELAKQLGVDPKSLHRWCKDARAEREKRIHARLISKPCGNDEPCDHTRALRLAEKWYCLDCDRCNFEDHPLMRRRVSEEPRPERRTYKPGELRGGRD